MDDTQALECTQALPIDWDEDDSSGEKQVVAWLEIDGSRHEIFEGETKIGRDPATCQIILQKKVLSKEHAVFEVQGDTHIIADLGSMNKTRIGKMVLKPKVRYALQGDEQLRFGDIKAKYIIKEKTVIDDSGSETGSESMLLNDTEDCSMSPVLSHRLPGLDTTNDTSCATPRPLQSKAQDLSDFIPETPTCQPSAQNQNSAVPSTSGLKTIIPESPLASQSTPLPNKVKLLSAPESPANISAIQNVSAAVSEDDDSFFFDPSQPTKKKEKEKKNVDSGMVSKATVNDIEAADEEDIPTQMFEDDDFNESNKTEEALLGEKVNKKVDFKVPDESTVDKSDEMSVDEEKAVEESKDDGDIFDQPTQAFVEPDKKLESEKGTITANDKSVDDDDIFNQPTQAFAGGITPVRKDIGKRMSSAQADHDDTQDIMDAFGIEQPKSFVNDNDDDTDDESLIPTQPFKAREKEAAHDDDDVPTQLFLDDDDDNEIVFKKPFTAAPKVKKNIPSDAKSKDADAGAEGILDAPTQLYSYDDLEAPTQVFEDNAPTQKFGILKHPVHKEKLDQEKDDDADVDEYFNEPTQPFMSKEVANCSDLEAPTQHFNEKSPNNAPKDDDNIDDFFNEPTQAFIAPKDNAGVDFDAPTQAFIAPEDNAGVDLDAPTQAFIAPKDNAGVDFDAPTQAFSERDINEADYEAPTQAFTGGREEDINAEDDDDLPPTQAFQAPSPKASVPKERVVDDDDLPPTQAFQAPPKVSVPEEGVVDDDDLAPTQPFSAPNPRPCIPDVSENVPTHEETDDRGVDLDAPTQIFEDNTTPQAITPKQDEHDDYLAPTQVFTAKKSEQDDCLAPTQVFTALKNDQDDDCLAPTQVFTTKTTEVSASAPTQIVEDKTDSIEMDVNAPTQVFHGESPTKTDDGECLAPTQAFEEVDCDAPTQVFTDHGKMSPEKEPKRGISEVWDKLDADATQDIGLEAVTDIDEVHSGNVSAGPTCDKNSNIQVSPGKSESAKVSGKEVCLSDDDSSSTVSENLLEQADQQEEENYYSDESTDIEDDPPAPKDTSTNASQGNDSCNMQLSHMSRLELSSESDSGAVKEDKMGAANPSESEISGEVPDKENKLNIGGDTSSSRSKSGMCLKAVDRIKNTRASPKTSSHPSVNSPSTQDLASITDEKIIFADSESETSTPQKQRGVPELTSDSETDVEYGNVSQILFDLSEDDDMLKRKEKDDNESRSVEEFSKSKAEEETESTPDKKRKSRATPARKNKLNLSAILEEKESKSEVIPKSPSGKSTETPIKQGRSRRVGRSGNKSTDSEESDNFSGFSSSPEKKEKTAAGNEKKVEHENLTKGNKKEAEESLPKRRGGRRTAQKSALEGNENLSEIKSEMGKNKAGDMKDKEKLDMEVKSLSVEKVETEDKNSSSSDDKKVIPDIHKEEVPSVKKELRQELQGKGKRNTRKTLACLEIGNAHNEETNKKDSNERGSRNRRSLNLPSSKEQRTSSRTIREPKRYSPDKDLEASISSAESGALKPRGRRTATKELVEETSHPSKRRRQSAMPSLNKNVNEKSEVDIQSSVSKQTGGKEVGSATCSTDAKVKEDEHPKREPQRRGRRSAAVSVEDTSSQQSSSERIAKKEISEPIKRGHAAAVPKENNSEESSSSHKPGTKAKKEGEAEESEPTRKGRRSAMDSEKEKREEPEMEVQEKHDEPPRRGRKSAVTKQKEEKKDIANKDIKQETEKTEEKASLEDKVETRTRGRKSTAANLKDKKADNKMEESKQLPSRGGRRSAALKPKSTETDNSTSTEDTGAGDGGKEVESSRRGRRSAVQRSAEDAVSDLSQEKIDVPQKRGKKWVVSSAKEDEDESSNKRAKLIMTFKAKESDSQGEDPLPRRVRKSIATAHPATMEVASSSRQTRLSMIPEKLEEQVTSKSRRAKKLKVEEQAIIRPKEEKVAEATPRSRRSLKPVSHQVTTDESSDNEHGSKRSSSQDSPSSGSRKRSRMSSISSEDLLSTPKAARTARSKMNSPRVKDILWSPSQRQQYANVRPKVLFTGYKDENDERIVVDLGGVVVESPRECSVLVTLNVRRTCKLLAVIGKGLPIVTPEWLSVCKQAGNFVDPWKYLVRDIESEKKFGFHLEQSLLSAKNSLIFEGLSLHATKSVKPPPDQMKEIIECSGGIYLDAPPKRYSPEIRVISCPEDKNQWTSFKRLNIPVLGTEFILTGLLRHQLLLDDFQLA